MSQSAIYSRQQAEKANLTLEVLGIPSWEPQDVIALQKKLGIKDPDGWFGPKSIEVWKAWARKNEPKPAPPKNPVAVPGCVIVNGMNHNPPVGVQVVNFLEPRGIPAEKDDVSPRKYPVTQLIIHRGAETRMASENYAQATERVLDARGLSTTFSMDVDGVVYQHFDPAVSRGRHCSFHNVQSDSIDVAGPFTCDKHKALPGQTVVRFQAAIGRENDNLPPLKRKYGKVVCWSMTPAQVSALSLFLPWWCQLRGIPATACEDWRTFRLSGGLGIKDPTTDVKGILAHAQVSEPGRRVDGLLELLQVKEAGAAIQWRSGADFFNS